MVVGTKDWLYDEAFPTVQTYALEKDVLFSGYVEEHELPSIYRGAEFAVFPSFYEGFGMPLLEPMQAERPSWHPTYPLTARSYEKQPFSLRPRTRMDWGD